MNNIVEKERIENLIYEVRGKQVMLDSDLAKLYRTETKRINEAVRNNSDKFPERFSWVLTDMEEINLRSKISTSSDSSNHGGRRYNIRVFTEQGVAMLATVLKSKIATQVSIAIMDAFVAMKKYISSNLIEQKYINGMVIEHEERLKTVENAFSNFKEKNNHIFFEGQIYDAYSLLLDIFNKSKNEIIIIDNYIDKCILDILSKTKKEDYSNYK